MKIEQQNQIKEFLNEHQSLYRIVSDEFIILDLFGTKDDAICLYQQIQESTINFIESMNYEIYYTISAGILDFCSHPTASYTEIMKWTEFALNKAKESGKNTYNIFLDEDYQKFQRESSLIRYLHQAIDHAYEGFDVYFQPIINIKENKVENLPNVKNDIVVSGIEDIKVNIASCCKPVKNDDIIGYITKGNGITVHRTVCPNVSDKDERIIDVKWNSCVSKKYPTSLLIRCNNSKNMLMDIIAKTSNTDITIESIRTISSTDEVLYEITVIVEDNEKLNKYINDLHSLSLINSIEREIL